MICLLLQFPLEKANVNLFQTDSTGATSWKKLLLKKQITTLFFYVCCQWSVKYFSFYVEIVGCLLSFMFRTHDLFDDPEFNSSMSWNWSAPSQSSNLILMSNVKTRKKRKGKTKKYREQSTLKKKVNGICVSVRLRECENTKFEWEVKRGIENSSGELTARN